MRISHRAIDSGHDDLAKMVLDRHGCPLDVCDRDGDTPLHLATRSSNKKVVAVLLRRGANSDLKNAAGDVPLLEAVRAGDVAMAGLLLRGGAAVNVAGSLGTTPLMLAASSLTPGMPDLVDTLLR